MVVSWWNLPGEIRNQIYEDVSQSRDLAMMRTNSRVCGEMRGALFKKVPYRMYLNYPKRDKKAGVPVRKVGEGVQLLEIYWRCWEQYCLLQQPGLSFPEEVTNEGLDCRPCLSWGGLEAKGRRRRCVLYFEKYYPEEGVWLRKCDMRAVSSLGMFEDVVLRVAVGGEIPAGCDTRELARRSTANFKKSFERLWGPGEEGWDQGGSYVRFRPGLRAVPGVEEGVSEVEESSDEESKFPLAVEEGKIMVRKRSFMWSDDDEGW